MVQRLAKAGICSTPGVCDTSPIGHGGKNWVTRAGGLPPHVRAVAHALMREKGMDESQAIATALNAERRWGRAKRAKPQTKTNAAASLARWEAMRAESHATSKDAGTGDEMAAVSGVQSYSLRGEITKYDEPQKNFWGWAYVTHDEDGNLNVDKSGEFVVDPVELEKAACDFALTSRTGDVFHDMGDHSTMIESVVFTPEKQEAIGIPPGTVPTGWFVGFHTESDDLFQKVKDGEWMFSIHGSSVKTPVGP